VNLDYDADRAVLVTWIQDLAGAGVYIQEMVWLPRKEVSDEDFFWTIDASQPDDVAQEIAPARGLSR
jgi:hypothetical protein